MSNFATKKSKVDQLPKIGVPTSPPQQNASASRSSRSSKMVAEEDSQIDTVDLRLIEIDGLWVISREGVVPEAQLSFLCDLSEMNYFTVLDKFKKKQYKLRDFHTHEFFSSFFNNEDQMKLACNTFKEISEDTHSKPAAVLFHFLSQKDKKSQIEAPVISEDDCLTSLLNTYCLIQQGMILEAFFSSLKNFMSFGFYYCMSQPPLLPKFNGFQLLLALFDCFALTHSKALEDQLQKDMYFGGENLIQLIYHYFDKRIVEQQQQQLIDNNQSQDKSMSIQYKQKSMNSVQSSVYDSSNRGNKYELLEILEKIMNKVKKMKLNGVKHSLFLYHQLLTFYLQVKSKVTLKDENQYLSDEEAMNNSFYKKELSLIDSEKLSQTTPRDINFYNDWLSVKAAILRGEKVTKIMETIWNVAAFKELYIDATQMMGEKNIIISENTQIAIRCFALLTYLGEKTSFHLHYSLLCYHGLYKEAFMLLEDKGSQKEQNQLRKNDIDNMKVQCMIRNSQLKESLEILTVLGQTRVEAYDVYLLARCVFTQEEKDFFTALCLLISVTGKSVRGFRLFDDLLIAKLLIKGNAQGLIKQNIVIGCVILKILLRKGKYEFMKDYMCKLFIKKNLQKVKDSMNKQQKLLVKQILENLGIPKASKKQQQNTLKGNIKDQSQILDQLPITPSHWLGEKQYEKLLELSVNDLKTFIQYSIQNFKQKSSLQHISQPLKQHYEDIIKIGDNVLFLPEKMYSFNNLETNYVYLRSKNYNKLQTVALSSKPIEIYSLKNLIMNQGTIQIFSFDNINYKILKYFYQKKTMQIQKSNNSREAIDQQITEESYQNDSYQMEAQKQLERIEEKTESSQLQSVQSQEGSKLQNDTPQQTPNPKNNLISIKEEKQPEDTSKESDILSDINANNSQLKESQIKDQAYLINDNPSNNTDRSNIKKMPNEQYQTQEGDNKIKAQSSQSQGVRDYFNMQLNSNYSIDFEGKFMQNELLLFQEEDLIFESSPSTSYQNQIGRFRFNQTQKFKIDKVDYSKQLFDQSLSPLLKMISPFCLKYYGFYLQGPQWFVLYEPFDEHLDKDTKLSLLDLYSICQILTSSHLLELGGVFAYKSLDLFYKKEGKIYFPNIISLIQLMVTFSQQTTKQKNQNFSTLKDYQFQDKNSKNSVFTNENIPYPNCCAPELFSGSLMLERSKCDVWTIGAVLFRSMFNKEIIKLESKDELSEIFKLKDSKYLSELIDSSKQQYYQQMKQKSDQSATIPPNIMEVYISVLKMSLIFDSEMRSCSEEISTFLFLQIQQLGQNIQNVAEKAIDDQLLEWNDSKDQKGEQNPAQQKSVEQEERKKPNLEDNSKMVPNEKEQIFVTGSNSFLWVDYQSQLVYYRDIYSNNYIIHNDKIQSHTNYKLTELLVGEGLLINARKEYFVCQFKSPFKIRQLEIVNDKNKVLEFDDNQIITPSSVDQILEKQLLQQAKQLRQTQYQSPDSLFNNALGLIMKANFFAMYQQYHSYLSNLTQINGNMDLFGNLIYGRVDRKTGTVVLDSNENVKKVSNTNAINNKQDNKIHQKSNNKPPTNNTTSENKETPIVVHSFTNKSIYITSQSCFIFDRLTLSLLFFYPLQLENENLHSPLTLSAILDQIFIQQQPYLSLFSSHTICYAGNFYKNGFEDGVLLFKSKNELSITQHPEENSPYQTKISYNNHSHYFQGSILKGMYNGYGEYYNSKQLLYKGIFESNFLTEGTICFDQHPTYAFYEGQLTYDNKTQTYMMHGEGKCMLKDKTVFEGQFENNQFSGKGKLIDRKKKAVYEGFWRAGLKEGQGIYSSKKNQYEGEFKEGKKFNYGKQILKKGKEIYEGEFKNNKRNGNGVLRLPYAEGIIYYRGEFQDDKRHGEGVEISQSQQKFIVRYYKDECIRRKQARMSEQEFKQTIGDQMNYNMEMRTPEKDVESIQTDYSKIENPFINTNYSREEGQNQQYQFIEDDKKENNYQEVPKQVNEQKKEQLNNKDQSFYSFY